MGLFSMLRYDPYPIKGKGSEHYLELMRLRPKRKENNEQQFVLNG